MEVMFRDAKPKFVEVGPYRKRFQFILNRVLREVEFHSTIIQ